jgi:S-adenosylmethionine synthetase
VLGRADVLPALQISDVSHYARTMSTMESIIVSQLEATDEVVEIVERKGLGHPDTICDALAETLSRNLCREYLGRFGAVLHHNVDKALLCGGRAAPVFGGGRVIEPINIYLAGRAIMEVGGNVIPIEEIAVEGSRAWLRANLHALDAERDVRIAALVQPGSQDLQELSLRLREGVALANDTSIGVAHAPLSALERLVLAVEKHINGKHSKREHPAWGEDVKVMGIRRGMTVCVTVACAMIGRYLAHMDDYLAETVAVADAVRELSIAHGFPESEVRVNAADSVSANSIYLTVTGTSAEAGDDGQVGRGNRVNGLITPCKPMSLEAAAGKNPVTHVGKIYNVLAQQIAENLVVMVPEIAAAQCLIVGQIGAPITEPAMLQVRLAMRDGMPIDRVRPRVAEIASDHLARATTLVQDFIAGKIAVF